MTGSVLLVVGRLENNKRSTYSENGVDLNLPDMLSTLLCEKVCEYLEGKGNIGAQN